MGYMTSQLTKVMMRINLVNRLMNGVVLPEDKPLIKREKKRKETNERPGSRGGEEEMRRLEGQMRVPL